ncbi:MAG: hypothetical protein RBU27_09135 [Bacteroidota bacterium]|jgi:hypothetical protein|nr:hypothetical protein [Bacteroidota bacterium]
MKRSLSPSAVLLLLSVIWLLLPVVTMGQQVTFSERALNVGLTRAMVDSMELVGLISIAAEGMDQAFDMQQSERKAFSETILEVSDGVVTRKRMTFSDARARSAQPMQPVSVTNAPVVGKTYIVTYLPDSVAVTDDDGAAVPTAERDYIVKEFSRKVENQFAQAFNGRTMSVGEEFELKGELLELFGANLNEALRIRNATFRLDGVGQAQGMRTALIGIDVVFGGAQGPMEMEIAMKGTLEIGVENLWPISLVMDGSLTGAGNHGGVDLTADGTMKMARLATYQ